ncbi:hypothetical protein KTQ81_21595 [Salmonella enterica subsp. diarizonae]|uniref:hypothetical protein n=1 Tax=Salmonella enterica TaxID=28901 RepID=UPI001CF309A6|nr:hypothetical protein [Salmonella enterica subsp. diarizonae]
MNQNFNINYIENFKLSVKNKNLEELGREVFMLKLAVCLLFRKLPTEQRDAFLIELQQDIDPEAITFIEQIKQFNL